MDLAYLSSLFWLLIYLQQNSVSAKDNFGLKWLNQIYSKASYHCGKSSQTIYWTFERFILSSNSPKFLKTHQYHHIQTSLLFPEKCFITQIVNAINLERVQIMVTSENASAIDPMYQFEESTTLKGPYSQVWKLLIKSEKRCKRSLLCICLKK